MAVVNGSAQLRALALRLKAAPTELRVQLPRGLRVAASPLIADVKAAARDKLPRAGGLNEQVAGQRVSVSVRTGARTAGVRLTTTAPDTQQTDSGYVRHPVFARRREGPVQKGKSRVRGTGETWVRQEIPNATGWWSQTLADDAPKVTPAILAVMENVGGMIQGRGF